MIKTSIVIPTLNAASLIGILIEKLQNQTIKPDEIIVIDSSSDDETVSIASSYPYVKTIIIPREEFNHGATRHKALMETIGDYICFLTQDAVPSNERYLSNLLAPFDCENVGYALEGKNPRKTHIDSCSLFSLLIIQINQMLGISMISPVLESRLSLPVMCAQHIEGPHIWSAVDLKK